MSTNNPHGFTEHRHLGGRVNPSTRWYQVKANGASGSHFKFPGDPVLLVSGNSVARIPVAATAAPIPLVGVIRACYTGTKRPLTFNQPSVGGGFIPASTAGWVEVNVDPFQTYLVNTDATVNSAIIGNFVDITAGVPSTAAGRSGMSIEVATCAISVSANAVVSQFQVIAIGDDNLDGIIGGENNQDVEVKIAHHAFNLVR